MKIDQFLPTLAAKDGVGNEALMIKSILKKWGFKSRIFAEKYSSDVRKQFTNIKKHKRSDVLIYHHSIGCDTAEYIKQAEGKKILIYHNITPEQYFKDNIKVANEVKRGRNQLRELRDCFDLSLSDSEFNRQELKELGYKNTHVLPLLIDFSQYNLKPDKKILDKYSNDGYKNLVFVGKIAPHKRQAEIIKTFYYFNKLINPKSRLFLVGSVHGFGAYATALMNLKKSLELENIIFTDSVSQESLNAYYKITDAFISMSEHEGFCVPLIESMFFKIPIIAYAKAAVPWTLDSSGILFDTNNHLEIAELINHVIENKNLKDAMIKTQQERLKEFALKENTSKLKKMLDSVL